MKLGNSLPVPFEFRHGQFEAAARFVAEPVCFGSFAFAVLTLGKVVLSLRDDRVIGQCFIKRNFREFSAGTLPDHSVSKAVPKAAHANAEA